MEDKEINQKIKACKSVDELKAIGKEAGFELTDDEAQAYLAKLSTSAELSDDELGNVSGGVCFKTRGTEIYLRGTPSYLMTNKLRTCLLYEPSKPRALYCCFDCANLTRASKWPTCCRARTYDNDPLNP